MPHPRPHLRCGLVAALLFAAFASASPVRAEYGDIVINTYADKARMRPPIFPHWFHRIRFACKVCHADLGFKFKAGGNDINMLKIFDGQFCGACHNNEIAWGVENCILCHAGKWGLKTQVHDSAPRLVVPPDAPLPSAGITQRLIGGEVNSFNRLLKRDGRYNLPPAESGIYDPEHPGTYFLQEPAEAFQNLPRRDGGNRVDWVKAVESGAIRPRYERTAPGAAAPLALDIVRQVKGSMPDVVFPHRQHSLWLDCANCHDEIFAMEKGKTPMSMAAILLGQQCGTCHGKVAFPLYQCDRCHSRPKSPEQMSRALTGTPTAAPGQRN